MFHPNSNPGISQGARLPNHQVGYGNDGEIGLTVDQRYDADIQRYMRLHRKTGDKFYLNAALRMAGKITDQVDYSYHINATALVRFLVSQGHKKIDLVDRLMPMGLRDKVILYNLEKENYRGISKERAKQTLNILEEYIACQN